MKRFFVLYEMEDKNLKDKFKNLRINIRNTKYDLNQKKGIRMIKTNFLQSYKIFSKVEFISNR